MIATRARWRHSSARPKAEEDEDKRHPEDMRKPATILADIIEHSNEVFYVHDIRHKLTYVSPKSEQIFGYRPDEMMVKWTTLITDNPINQIGLERTERALKTGRRQKPYLLEAQRKNGSKVLVEVDESPLKDDHGKVIGIVGAIRDVTERKKAENVLRDSEEKFRLLSEQSLMGLAITAKDRLIYFNKAFAEITGYSTEELSTVRVNDLIQRSIYPKDRDHVAAQLMKKFRGDEDAVLHDTFRIITTSGKLRWLDEYSEAITYQGETAVFVMIIDITERKRAEERIERLNLLKVELLNQLTLAEKLKHITDRIVEIFNAEFARIWINKEGDLCETDCMHAAVKEGPHACRHRDRCLHLMASSGRYAHADGKIYSRVPFGCYEIGRVAAGQYAKFITNDVVCDQRIHDRVWAKKLGLVSFAGYPLLSTTGKPIGVLALFCKHPISSDEDTLLEDLANTTAQVIQTAQAEEAMRESELQYRTTIDSMGDAIHVLDEDLKIILVNMALTQWLRKMGIGEEVVGRTAIDVLPFFSAEMKKEYRQVFATGKPSITEDRFEISGQEYIAETRKIPIFEGSKVIRVVTVIHDVTKRKRAEGELRNVKRRFEDIAWSSADWIWEVDKDGKYKFTSGSVKELLGYEPEELLGKTPFELMPKEEAKRIAKIFRKIATERKPIVDLENWNLTKAGDKVCLLTNGLPILDENGGLIGYRGVDKDITARKRAEAIQSMQYRIANAVHTTQDSGELFRAIQQDLSTLLDTKNFFIALYNREDDTISLPYFKDEKDHFETFPAGKTLTAYVIKHDKPLLATRAEFERLSQSGEVETIGTDSKVWLGVPLKAGEETIGALVVQSYAEETDYDEKDLELLKFVSHQIGLSIERKMAQEALKASEERYRIVTAQTGQLIYDCNLRNGDIEWSGAIEAVTGHSPKEFQKVGYDQWKEMIHAEDREKVQRHFDESDKKSSTYRVEYKFCTKNGNCRDICDEGVFLSDENGEAFRLLGAMKDVTEQKRAEKALRESEEQLRQSQKMEAVGRLAGGVAHDLNNLLTGVTGYGDLLASKIHENDSLRRYVIEIQKAAQRATALIGQLLAFSRKQVLQFEVLSLNDIVQNIQDMLKRVIGQDIELAISLASNLGHVKADPGQLEQVIMNLAVNARDAMPHGGRLTIETADVELDDENARRHGDALPGSYVMLAMSDTGIGMNEEVRRRIFEPFFTTKEVGKGTGLGLSIIYGIVKQSGGNIWVYSEPERGTIFKIFLPRIERDIKPKATRSFGGGRDRGAETILLVEDENMIRDLAREILQKNGYTVLVAHNGLEALSICEQQKGPIHLLITDVIMPQMNGYQLAQRLVSQRKETKVLYISGYTDQFVAQLGSLESSVNLLQKPFSSDALSEKVRQILDAHKCPKS